MTKYKILSLSLFLLGSSLISFSLWHLCSEEKSLSEKKLFLDHIPVTLYQKRDGPKGPAVVIAHGFAGSQQLMQAFAITLANNGYVAITFDFAGHGRNDLPLTGNLLRTDGATQVLVSEIQKIAEFALSEGDGRLALLGHSMASDLIVRAASLNSNVAATITVSMFSPAVTSEIPRNLLILVGDWELRLKQEALRAVGLVSSPASPKSDVTYGNFREGTARRASFIPYAEHISVLYRNQSLIDTLNWLDTVFEIKRDKFPEIHSRGLWIFLLFAGILLLIWPLTSVLPLVSSVPMGAGAAESRFWMCLITPALLTPLLLSVLPTHFLPIIVGDYLGVHLAVYGLLTMLCLVLTRVEKIKPEKIPRSWAALGLSTALLMIYFLFGYILPINAYFTSFIPAPSRLPIIGVLSIGTLLFFLSDEWLTRGLGSIKGAYLISKVAFIFSLVIAVSLNFQKLFFLILIIPIILLFFLIFGFISTLTYRRTGCPLVAGLSNAFSLAWAIGVTFPMLAG